MNTKSEKMTRKIGFISLGCAKNLVNTEQMMYLLKEAGYEVTGETDGMDVVVINTCSFIESAKVEAIENILSLGWAKAEGRIGKIIVAGCLPERYKEEVLSEIPEIDVVLGVGGFENIVGAVKSSLEEEGEDEGAGEGESRKAFFGDIDAPVSETGRIITTSPSWAYLKIAEGCDNRCAFCVIPGIRGRYRSRTMDNIVREARELTEQGKRELIIVAQDVTRYGLDLYGKRSLPGLLEKLCDIEALKWIRLHYLYPADVDEKLIDTIAEKKQILNYLDIPIQHINDIILRKMNRRDSNKKIRELIKRSRERITGAVIRTTVITGLPGEGDTEYKELKEFLAEVRLERVGVFPYSPEEETAAALMDRPDSETALRRAEEISQIQSGVMTEFNKSRIGSATTVLIEGFNGVSYYGRSYAESPDVDGYIYIRGFGIKRGDFVEVRITGIENGELVACKA